MKKPFLSVILCIIVFVSAAQKGTTTTRTIITDGTTRSYILYVPAIYNGSIPVPLLLNFHGLGSNAGSQADYSNFQPIADTANFIMVLPEGLVRFGTTGWNCFGPVDPNIDDLRFVSHLIDSLKTEFNINPNRIYSTGFSNGGFMSHDLACFMSTRIAAIASVSGTMMDEHLQSCNPHHPTPVMQIHGTSDNVVTYTGTGGTLYSANVDSIIMYWVRYNNCNRQSVYTALPDINTSDSCTAEHYVYSSGRGGSSVELYKITGGGHSWPGATTNTSQGNTDRDFSASIVIWNFLRQYDKTQSIDDEQPGKVIFNVFPNPAVNEVTVETDKELQGTLYSVFNLYGKEVLSGRLKENTTPIDISQLNAGIYIFRANQVTCQALKIVKE